MPPAVPIDLPLPTTGSTPGWLRHPSPRAPRTFLRPRLGWLCGLLLVLHLQAHAQVKLEQLPTLSLFGMDYINLRAWANAASFQWRTVPGQADLLLSNRWARLEFTLDSRKAQINNITLYLSRAVVDHGRQAYISKMDLQTMIHPVLFPARPSPPARVRTIALDPGHGGKDPGFQDGRKVEKDYTLLLAQELRDKLRRCGLKVVLTRATDRFVDLERRPAIARSQRADLLVSLHFNAASRPGNNLHGVETYCLTPAGAPSTGGHGEGIPTDRCLGNRQDQQNALLAFQIHKSLVNSLGLQDLGVRRARWIVLRQAQMPAALIEGGYLSDPQEARKIYTPTYRRQLAQAILDGILAYKRLVER